VQLLDHGRDRRLSGIGGDTRDRVACRNLSLLEHAQIEAESPAFEKLAHEAGPSHAQAELEAGSARPGHGDDCPSDSERVSDASRFLENSFRREVFAKETG
jgi:hypothetical protein